MHLSVQEPSETKSKRIAKLKPLGTFSAFFYFWVSITCKLLKHTGQCKRTGGCYNELVVALLRTGDGLKGKKFYTC